MIKLTKKEKESVKNATFKVFGMESYRKDDIETVLNTVKEYFLDTCQKGYKVIIVRESGDFHERQITFTFRKPKSFSELIEEQED